jgi:hypothetical protein
MCRRVIFNQFLFREKFLYGGFFVRCKVKNIRRKGICYHRVKIGSVSRVCILEGFLKYNISCLMITNCLVITAGALTKDDLLFIVDSLESTSAASLQTSLR